MTEEQIKIPVSVKKMETALKNMEILLQNQKLSIQQIEKEFHQFKKFANTFIEVSKKKNEKKPKKPSGFALPVPISTALCTFLNIPEGSQVSRTEVTRFLIHYIQENNLINPEKKTLIIPNEPLSVLLGSDVDLETLTRFSIQKYMNQHYLSNK
jgi:chromatin remodeling complex protein RSC6